MMGLSLPRSSAARMQNTRIPRSAASEHKPERKKNLRKAYSDVVRESSVTPPATSADWSMWSAGPVDSVLAATVIALIAFGVVMVYSASSVWAYIHYHDGQRLLVRQAWHAAVGLVFMAGFARLDYHRLRRLTNPMLLGSLLLMAATAFGLGHSAGGAVRWLPVGPVRVQTAELAKLAFICWMAYSLSRKTQQLQRFSVGFLPHALVAAAVVGLCLLQRDFVSAAMIELLLFCMLFVAGTPLVHMLIGWVVSLLLAYGAITQYAYRVRRITSFVSGDTGYQIRESWMSFGAGGVTGVGFGEGHQKLLFLPEAHTDFISAIVGEELGLIGFTVMLLAFLLILWRGIMASFHAVDEYGTHLAAGLTLFVGIQAFTNLAVAVGLFPTKGLVLPFISYGGSSLLVNCCCVGILLNVSRLRSSSVSLIAMSERNGAGPRVLGGVA
jgi:cell division protein FtsW